MERLDVFDCSNVLMPSNCTVNRDSANENRELRIIYL